MGSSFRLASCSLFRQLSLSPPLYSFWLCAVGLAFFSSSIFPAFKQYYFDAESQYKQALKDLEDKKYGLAVGRLHVARNLLKKTSEAAQGLSGSYKLDPSSLARAVEEKLAKAEKDNQMIYIEPVPKPEA